MITDNFTARPALPQARSANVPQTNDLVGLLVRAYREAGLPTEAARRCALADFRCNFPQLLGV